MTVDLSVDTREAVFSACTRVVASDLPDGAALLDMAAGKYYSLNLVGALVWKQLQAPVSVEQIAAAVAHQFDITIDECRPDVGDLLSALVGAGLVEVSRVKAVEAVI